MLKEELKNDEAYTIEDFEIVFCGEATDQMVNYFNEELKSEM